MRGRLLFVVILAAAAALSALLLLPRLRPGAAPEAGEPGGPESSPAPALTAAASAPAASNEPPPPAPPLPLPAYVRVDPGGEAACPKGMALVEGIYCPFVGHKCRRFASEADDICSAYAPEVLCEGRLQRRRFCIDVLEYPNIEGLKPVMMVSFDDARRACALEGEGKRLCTVEEWEFACEGTQMWPYPYGLERDAEACNIDRPKPSLDAPLLESLGNPRTMPDAIEALDGRAPSGQAARCISPFGVRDMTGNVEEWVENPSAALENKPVQALKGGSWDRARARCRPVAQAGPSEPVRLLGVGFRCCADAKGGGRSMSVAPPGVALPRTRVMESPRR